MPYLICDECEIYYEIDSDFNIDDLDTCEKCGRNLKCYNDFQEYYNKKDTPRENAGLDNLFIFKNYDYNKMVTAGFILAIIGLFMFILAIVSPFFFILHNFENPSNISTSFVQTLLIYVMSFVFMIAGVLIYIYSKRKENHEIGVNRKNRKKIVKREKPVSNYFKKLPEGYFILNNLKIPGRKIMIDHVVIGPTGMFLVNVKNLSGNYIINGNEWLNNKGKMTLNSPGNPSQQVKLNAIELKRFLDSKNLDIDYVLINSIVAFSNRNFTVRKMPRTYNIMHVDEISNFIVNSKTKMDLGTITESVVFLERYSSGVMRS